MADGGNPRPAAASPAGAPARGGPPAGGAVLVSKNKGLLIAALLLAMLMQILDMTIANIALPSMQASLGAAQDTISWVLTSYIVASAIATPLTGWFADRFGRREVFLTCVVGFVGASALCGMAFSLEQMVLYRVLQGAFGAALAPLAQATMLDVNPPERRGSAMALFGAVIMVGPVIGPSLGGWLTENFNWRWVFYINVPVGLFAFLGIWFFMPETPRRIRRFDLFGFAILSLALGAVQMLLDRGEGQDWFQSAEIWVYLGLFVGGIWVFVIHSVTAAEPFIDMHLFRDRNFVTGSIFMFIVGIILLATMALLPPMLQTLFGYPTITAGNTLAPRGLGTMVSMIFVGRMVQKVDPRYLMLFGLGLLAYSLWEMTKFSPDMNSFPVVYSGVIQGFSFGFMFIPLNSLAFATLPPRLRVEGTAIFNLVRNLGSAIGISMVTTILSQTMQINHAELGSRITPFVDLPQNGFLDSTTLATGNPQVISILNNLVTAQSAMISYLNDFKVMFFITIAAIPLLLFLRRPKQPAGAGGPPPAPAPAMVD